MILGGLDATDAPDVLAATEVEYRFDPQRTCELLADTVAKLHALPVRVADDDTTTRLRVRSLTPSEVVAEAHRLRGTLGEPRVGGAYRRIPVPRLLDILEEGASRASEIPDHDLVFTHGSPSLDSLRCRDGSAVGFVDWSTAALADRHRDLAVAATSVAEVLGPMLVPTFFERYGCRPDPVRLDWWALAEQLVCRNRPPAP